MRTQAKQNKCEYRAACIHEQNVYLRTNCNDW